MKHTTETNPYGPKYYLLHRDNIREQIAGIQQLRGVAYPSNITRWILRPNKTLQKNVLRPQPGRMVEL